MILVKTGSTWSSSNGKLFQVVAVAKTEIETWITYKDMSSGEHYSCLAEAFVQRFHLFVNHVYN
jgi:hypothetical protein